MLKIVVISLIFLQFAEVSYGRPDWLKSTKEKRAAREEECIHFQTRYWHSAQGREDFRVMLLEEHGKIVHEHPSQIVEAAVEMEQDVLAHLVDWDNAGEGSTLALGLAWLSNILWKKRERKKEAGE